MFSQKKPYTAVTVAVERLTSELFAEDDLGGIPELVEVVKLQASGPMEAARAIRKKLKYGNAHRQVRALVLLEGLLQNSGETVRRRLVDEPLLERLRVTATSYYSHPAAKEKCSELFESWALEYKATPGLQRLAMLYNEVPQSKLIPNRDQSKVLRETEQDPFHDSEEDHEREQERSSPALSSPPIGRPGTDQDKSGSGHVKSWSKSGSFFSSSKDKKKDKQRRKSKSKSKPFNLEAEMGNMQAVVAGSSMAATNLLNTLQTINREQERVSENRLALSRFEACKLLRRKILRYIHLIEEEKYLGGLLHANDELVTALMTFEQLDRSVDADSDSEDELAEQAHLYRMAAEKGKSAMSPKTPTSPTAEMAGLSIKPSPPPRPVPPPRPSALSKPKIAPTPVPGPVRLEESDGDVDSGEDDDDPFADRNAVPTLR